MPKCLNCGRELSRFDSDICPYCGQKAPFKEYKTMDVTSTIDPLRGEYKLYKAKSRVVAFVLGLLLGWLGVDLFYLAKPKAALVPILVTLVLAGGLGSLLYLLTPLSWLGYLVGFGVSFLLFLLWSFRYLLRDDMKDGNGEFLR